MEEKENNYSADYIRKYLDGQLSDQEMQALEKAALEDPFLADAIEGYEESRKHRFPLNPESADFQIKANRTNQAKKNRKRGWSIQFQNGRLLLLLYSLSGLQSTLILIQ